MNGIRVTYDNSDPQDQETPFLFSLETLIITVSAGAVAAVTLGFVTGYCCGRRCQKDGVSAPFADAEYEFLQRRQLPARPIDGGGQLVPGLQPLLQHSDLKGPQEETLYAEPILVNQRVNVSNPLG